MGSNWTDPVNGYAPYIDLSSWVDYHLHQTLVFNVDALRISAYFNKPRSGPIVQGPLWDFDRSFGTRTSDDGRGFNPRLWRSAEMDGGTDMFNPGSTFNNPWYGRLFLDPDFFQHWIDRYQQLRQSIYSLTNLMTQIDCYGDQVREATTREYARWTGSGSSDTSPRSGAVNADGMTYVFPTPGTWQGEINFTKWWFSNRLDFMDSNFLNPPVFSTNAGPIPAGYLLTITAPTREANSTIYYTLDGTDPRLPGGSRQPRRPLEPQHGDSHAHHQRSRLCPRLECKPPQPDRFGKPAAFQPLVRAAGGHVLHRYAALAYYGTHVRPASAARRQHQ